MMLARCLAKSLKNIQTFSEGEMGTHRFYTILISDKNYLIFIVPEWAQLRSYLCER